MDIDSTFNFFLENFTIILWSTAVFFFVLFTVLSLFFLWRISANASAMRNVMEEYLFGIDKSVKREQWLKKRSRQHKIQDEEIGSVDQHQSVS